jgi:ATP-dependent DNA ligase
MIDVLDTASAAEATTRTATLSNFFRMLLHSGQAAAELGAALSMLLGDRPVSGVFAEQVNPTSPQNNTDPSLVAVYAEIRQATLDADQNAATALSQVLAGKGLASMDVIQALALAFVLERPATRNDEASAVAVARQHENLEERDAAQVAMQRAVALAFAESGGAWDLILSAFLEDCIPVELFRRCGLACGTPLLLMTASAMNSAKHALSCLDSVPVLVEKIVVGERVQVHKSKERVSLFDAEGEEITSSLHGEEVSAIGKSLNPQACVIDAVMRRSPKTHIIGFDCLCLEEESLTRRRLQERRAALNMALKHNCEIFAVLPGIEFSVTEPLRLETLTKMSQESVASGGKGLMLKKLHSEYEAGSLSSSWVALSSLK